MRASPGIILLMGASGFIGSAFLKYSVLHNWRVRVVTRDTAGWLRQNGVEIVQGDFTKTSDWDKAVQGVDVVVNAAAEVKDPTLMRAVNVLGPERLLNASVRAEVKRWVQLSSVGSYGPVQTGLVDERWPDNPSDPYEVSKADFDEILKETGHECGIEVCIVRPSNVYGPGMRNQSIHQMLNAIRQSVFAFIGPAGASANYVHVEDVVQAIALCVSHPSAANQTYIVSNWATMEDMVSGLAAGAGLSIPTRRIPLVVATFVAISMQWWPRFPLTLSRVRALSVRSRFSTDRIEQELGWTSTVSVEKGMCQFAQGLR